MEVSLRYYSADRQVFYKYQKIMGDRGKNIVFHH